MMAPTERLIGELGQGLRPVRRAASPWVWVCVWLGAVAGAGWWLAGRADLAAAWRRIGAAPDLWLAVAGSVLTAVAAAAAAFMVGRPDRSPRWAWLPVPWLLLWQGANGVGCLRADVAGLHRITLLQAGGDCLPFILVTSAPLAVVMLVLLRRAPSLRPERTMLMGGLAVAAAAASLLWLDHPFDAGLADLVVHAVGVAVVVVAVRAARGWVD